MISELPVADRRPHRVTYHGKTIDDPYHWLRDAGYPEVTDRDILAYLEAENAYFASQMEAHQPLIDTLYEELKGRQQLDDASVPYKMGDYLYQWRFHHDAQYRVWSRAPVDEPEAMQVILDEPALAAQHDYFRLGGFSVSLDGQYLAWSSDTNGAERFTIRVKHLGTGEVLDDTIEQSLGAPVWCQDHATFFYLIVNDNWRPFQVRAHRLGEATDRDRIVYEEQDESFFVGLGETQSEQYILISAGDHITNETYIVPAADPEAPPRVISPRRSGHEYDVDHRDGRFYIRTNDTHKNFRLVSAPQDHPEPDHWVTMIDGSDSHYLRGLMCLRHWVIVAERLNGLAQIRVIADDGDAHYIAFPEPTYHAGIGTNAEYDVNTLRLSYESMVTPHTVYDYDLTTRQLTTRKVQQIPSGYDATQYVTERLIAPARDGVQVPVSVVYKQGFNKTGQAPLYLYGYGAYGHAIPPSFSTGRLSLLDRGFAFAIAHIRGGDDLGYHWYEEGKLTKRTNTFNDFVDVAQHLIEQQFTGPGRIAISGGSAGGELMGAVVNQAPELWGAVVAHVPFVDVLNTMLDANLPLTPIEWPEWGNPLEDPAAFELIQSYSPYDQIQAGVYPPMLVTAGLNDPRVTYWEPAKYVAKLRHLKTDDNLLLLKTNMGAGHSGKSGRFDSLYEVAEAYAFILLTLGVYAP
jgi:oligopeptidase B